MNSATAERKWGWKIATIATSAALVTSMLSLTGPAAFAEDGAAEAPVAGAVVGEVADQAPTDSLVETAAADQAEIAERQAAADRAEQTARDLAAAGSQDPNDANQLGAIGDSGPVALGAPVPVAADEEPTYVEVPTGEAGATRTISGKVAVQKGYESWCSDVRIYVVEESPGKNYAFTNSTASCTWSAQVPAGKYKVNFYSKTPSVHLMMDNWYPNKTRSTEGKIVDLTNANATGINANLRVATSLTGTVTLPAGTDRERTVLYALNSKGQSVAAAYPRADNTYTFYELPIGDVWVQAVSNNSKGKLDAMQFLKSGGKTKLAGTPGKVTTKNLTSSTAKSTISGKISVTGGLPKDFMRAANVYQRVDGIWFPLFYAWQNYPDYTGIKLAKGDYTVEFTAKTGRDVAKGEWWNKKSSQSKANIIKLSGTDKATGINGTLSSGSSGQVSPFKDVKSNHQFYNEIRWMYSSGTSTGTKKSDGRYYYPKNKVSREAMAAFMFRMNAPANYKAPTKSPFADVSTKHQFYKEIAWMKTSGLSTGSIRKGKRYYDPKVGVSREAMAAFMYRQYAKKDDKPVGYVNFIDVRPGAKFYKEIKWMGEMGLSTGVSTSRGKEYQPKVRVSREAMAAFLFRNALYR